MKKIKLTQGKYTIVDDEDYDWLNQWKWYAKKYRNNTFYACRWSLKKNGKRCHIRMHRLVLGLGIEDSRQCDHHDHDALNNRRCNLRACSNAQNQYNQKKRTIGTSKYKGVSYHKGARKWSARIQANKSRCFLGLFETEDNAAIAYNKMANVLHGEFAFLNKVGL